MIDREKLKAALACEPRLVPVENDEQLAKAMRHCPGPVLTVLSDLLGELEAKEAIVQRCRDLAEDLGGAFPTLSRALKVDVLGDAP